MPGCRLVSVGGREVPQVPLVPQVLKQRLSTSDLSWTLSISGTCGTSGTSFDRSPTPAANHITLPLPKSAGVPAKTSIRRGPKRLGSRQFLEF